MRRDEGRRRWPDYQSISRWFQLVSAVTKPSAGRRRATIIITGAQWYWWRRHYIFQIYLFKAVRDEDEIIPPLQFLLSWNAAASRFGFTILEIRSPRATMLVAGHRWCRNVSRSAAWIFDGIEPFTIGNKLSLASNEEQHTADLN